MHANYRLNLEEEVKDKEEDWEIFDLKKTSLDNVFYWSYGRTRSTGQMVET